MPEFCLILTRQLCLKPQQKVLVNLKDSRIGTANCQDPFQELSCLCSKPHLKQCNALNWILAAGKLLCVKEVRGVPSPLGTCFQAQTLTLGPCLSYTAAVCVPDHMLCESGWRPADLPLRLDFGHTPSLHNWLASSVSSLLSSDHFALLVWMLRDSAFGLTGIVLLLRVAPGLPSFLLTHNSSYIADC